MHPEEFEYVSRFSTNELISVIEIGSRDVNGSVRPLFPSASWTGLDIRPGPCVDIVTDAAIWRPKELVDLVVCCEVLEHAANWRELIQTASGWLRPGSGRLIITCAGPGREVHSAIDGRHRLLPGEHYLNLSESDIRQELELSGLREIEVMKNWFDTYATAIR